MPEFQSGTKIGRPTWRSASVDSERRHYLKRLLRLLVDIVVALSVIGACVALYRFGIIALLVIVFPLNDVQLTVLRRIGVTASLFAGYWAVAKYYERRIINEFALKLVAVSISAFCGIALIGLTIVSLFALNNYQLLSFRGFSAALPIMSAIVLGVLFEEVIFRGIIFRLLEAHSGTVIALLAQAPIFGVLHYFNDATTAMTVISVTLIGAFWTLIYVYSRNLWVVIANHAAWNVTIFVSGVPLSGQEHWRISAPFESSYQGPAWLTGGGFGPEDSVINILVMTCALGALTYWVWQQKRFVRGSSIEPKPSTTG